MIEIRADIPVPTISRERKTTTEVRAALAKMDPGESFEITKPVTPALCKRLAKEAGKDIVVAEGRCFVK